MVWGNCCITVEAHCGLRTAATKGNQNLCGTDLLIRLLARSVLLKMKNCSFKTEKMIQWTSPNYNYIVNVIIWSQLALDCKVCQWQTKKALDFTYDSDTEFVSGLIAESFLVNLPTWIWLICQLIKYSVYYTLMNSVSQKLPLNIIIKSALCFFRLCSWMTECPSDVNKPGTTERRGVRKPGLKERVHNGIRLWYMGDSPRLCSVGAQMCKCLLFEWKTVVCFFAEKEVY